jgi:outer membrane protein TolC
MFDIILGVSRMKLHHDSTTAAPAARIKTLGLAAAALLLGGCAVTPQLATQDEVRNRVKADTERMYLNQAPIAGQISMEEAVARALKYNLDYRLKKMESALALGLTDYSNYDMLPKLLTTAGYRTRSNDSGGTSIGIVDRQVSLRPSTSEERDHRLASAEFSWNVLDFGVSYYRAKQQADQYLIAEERRRKVVQSLLQDVRAAYWRALGAQRLEAQTQDVLKRANQALSRSREAEVQRIIPPAQALNYQRALLDATSLLNQRRQDLAFAKSELAALMNVPAGTDFTLAQASEVVLPAAPTDVRKLEELALLQRPELREEDFKTRITADETRKQLLSFLPGISFDMGVNYDSNRYLYNNNWAQGGINVSWNLMRLAALPSLKKTQAEQVKTDDARRLALSMAVMTQLRVGIDRYRLALEDFNLADDAAQVDKRLADYTRASVTARLDSELEAIRTQARAILGAYQRANAYANAQIAFGRLNNTLGFDPLPDNFEDDALPVLTERVRSHLRDSEKGLFQMQSNLFGQLPAVSVRMSGISDPALQARMQSQVTDLLTRNAFRVDAAKGMPMTFALQQDSSNGLEKASWTINLADNQGKQRGASQYTTTVPNHARSTVYEASLIAAASQSLTQMRSWLSMDGKPQP